MVLCNAHRICWWIWPCKSTKPSQPATINCRRQINNMNMNKQSQRLGGLRVLSLAHFGQMPCGAFIFSDSRVWTDCALFIYLSNCTDLFICMYLLVHIS